jgi:hypothetical protein
LILIAHFVSVISYFAIFGLYISALINLSAAYIFIVAYHLNLTARNTCSRRMVSPC